jgi:hypothetical protein
MVQQDLLDHQDHKAFLVQQAAQEQLAILVQLDHKAFLDQQDPLDLQVLKVFLDLQDQQV